MSVGSVARILGAVAITTFAAVVGVMTIVLAAQVKGGGDQPRVGPRVMIQTILTAGHLTEIQKADIKTIIEAHKAEIQAARQVHDPVVARRAMRETLREVVQTLTPEQREAAKDAVRKRLADR